MQAQIGNGRLVRVLTVVAGTHTKWWRKFGSFRFEQCLE